MKTKIFDPTVEIVKSIHLMEVPLQSEIKNPFDSNTRKKSKIVTKRSFSEIPENIEDWNSKDFVNYFAQCYKQHFNGIYKKTYYSDCSKINEFLEFMDANELNKIEWTKKFLDWCFENNDFIYKSTNTFTLGALRKYLNTFYQQVIYKESKSNVAVDIYDEVKEAIENGKTKEVLAIYGIPIVATYFINHKNIEQSKIKSGLKILFDNLIKGDLEELSLLNKITQRSISRSPYPQNFELLNWRIEFPKLKNKYKKELWWRDSDYNGNLQYKYDRFL